MFGLNLNPPQKNLIFGCQVSHSSGFSWNSETTGPKCKYHQSPGSWKEKQPVGKICSRWSDPAAVIPSNSCSAFLEITNSLKREGRRALLSWWWGELAATTGTELTEQIWQTPALGTKSTVHCMFYLRRVICASSEGRLTTGFMATIRGQLERGQLVSKTSALTPNFPLYKPPNPLFSISFLWPLNYSDTDVYAGAWVRG